MYVGSFNLLRLRRHIHPLHPYTHTPLHPYTLTPLHPGCRGVRVYGCEVCRWRVSVTANNKPNYLVLGLDCLLIGCAMFANIYYNLDILKAEYMYIYLHLYNILCMFDFPGFMIQSWSVMPLVLVLILG